MDEAADYVEVVRRLWDSWDDDAEIRDAATGRFVDRDKLHYIDFEGAWFSVRGPSITPRPPQGQPLVTVLAHSTVVYRLGARAADVVFVTPHDADAATAMVGEVRGEQAAAGRGGHTVHVFADVVVAVDPVPGAAAERWRRLDAALGRTYISDALIVAGTPSEVADQLQAWTGTGLTGFRLRPAALPDDLDGIVEGLVPELQRRGLHRTTYGGESLRARLGLPRPANRYAGAR
jgi:alkanesulfonate monooxygenase SsuD/methylene tetrahydromethanopterin reductase-like flavin-dependent oxidoreductase (luciferase family)